MITRKIALLSCRLRHTILFLLGAAFELAIPACSEAETFRLFGSEISGDNTWRILTTATLNLGPEASLFTLSSQIENIKLDVAGGKIYFTDEGTGFVRRANLDGTSPQTVVSGLSNVGGIGLDLVNGKLYYGDTNTNTIYRANLDGTSQAPVVTGVNGPFDIAIDAAGGKLYWCDVDDGLLKRADLNGSNVQPLATAQPGLGPAAIALDVVGGKVYWTELLVGIRRANLDGTNPQTVVPAQQSPVGYTLGLALDLTAGKMYWSELNSNVIRRANLDGTAMETALTAENNAGMIAFDPAARMIYWEEGPIGSDVRRAQLPLVHEIASGPQEVTSMRVLNHQLYYLQTDFDVAQIGLGAIYRVNSDGTSNVPLLSSLSLPVSLAIDPVGQKMYWSDLLDGIWRADLNGSNIEPLVNNSTTPAWMDLDLLNGKVYWFGAGSQSVYRADLDGANQEEVIPGMGGLRTIALHSLMQRIFLYETGVGIQRANLDGTNLQVIVQPEDSGEAVDLRIDFAAGKMYWSVDDDGPDVRRANFDGSNVETVMPGLFDVFAIALDTTGASEVYVDFAHTNTEFGTVAFPFNTVAEGLGAVVAGGTVIFAGYSSDTSSAEILTINQHVVLNAIAGSIKIGSSTARNLATKGFIAPLRH